MGKFSWDFTALFEQQLCDAPSSLCTQETCGLEFKIVKNIMQADTRRAWSCPLDRLY